MKFGINVLKEWYIYYVFVKLKIGILKKETIF